MIKLHMELEVTYVDKKGGNDFEFQHFNPKMSNRNTHGDLRSPEPTTLEQSMAKQY